MMYHLCTSVSPQRDAQLQGHLRLYFCPKWFSYSYVFMANGNYGPSTTRTFAFLFYRTFDWNRVLKGKTTVSFLHVEYVWPQMCGLFLYWPILRQQLGVLQFSSVWHYLPGVSVRSHKVKGSVPQGCHPSAHFRHNHKPHILTYTTDQVTVHQCVNRLTPSRTNLP